MNTVFYHSEYFIPKLALIETDSVLSQARAAKRSRKPTRIRAMGDSDDEQTSKPKRSAKAKKRDLTKSLTATEKAQEMRRLPLKEQVKQGQAKRNGVGKGFKSKRKFKRR